MSYNLYISLFKFEYKRKTYFVCFRFVIFQSKKKKKSINFKFTYSSGIYFKYQHKHKRKFVYKRIN